MMTRSVCDAVDRPAQRTGSGLENGQEPSPRPLDGVHASACTAHDYLPSDGDGQGFPPFVIIIRAHRTAYSGAESGHSYLCGVLPASMNCLDPQRY